MKRSITKLRDLRSLRSLRHSLCKSKARVSLELQEAILAPSRRLERTPCKALRGEGPSAFVLQEASLMPSAREGLRDLRLQFPFGAISSSVAMMNTLYVVLMFYCLFDLY